VADVEADLTIVTTGFGYTFALAGRQARVLEVSPIASGYISGEVGARPERQDLHEDDTNPRRRRRLGSHQREEAAIGRHIVGSAKGTPRSECERCDDALGPVVELALVLAPVFDTTVVSAPRAQRAV
jgi:hypothetical protein